ncbi:hypothetical protein ENBRE01_1795 [Enteropsectra breve]|nr:hypothetical protein ENBRE01_1694 [Enteropsectra breve]KAI5150938.1 hypothetical protein ENBRE01_1795 [Enteropsectra breve]
MSSAKNIVRMAAWILMLICGTIVMAVGIICAIEGFSPNTETNTSTVESIVKNKTPKLPKELLRPFGCTTPIHGLENIDLVNCYSNSAVQALISVPELYEYFRDTTVDPESCKTLHAFIQLLQDYDNGGDVISVKGLNAAFEPPKSYKDGNPHQDGSEFMVLLLERIMKECPKSKEFISKLFCVRNEEGHMPSCPYHPKDSMPGLYGIFANAQITEDLQGGVTVYIEDLNREESTKKKCECNVNAKMVPPYIIVNISRHGYDADAQRADDNKKGYPINEIIRVENGVKYMPYVFLIHTFITGDGNTKRGHYFTIIRSTDDSYIVMNDEHISKISLKKACQLLETNVVTLIMKKVSGPEDEPTIDQPEI